MLPLKKPSLLVKIGCIYNLIVCVCLFFYVFLLFLDIKTFGLNEDSIAILPYQIKLWFALFYFFLVLLLMIANVRVFKGFAEQKILVGIFSFIFLWFFGGIFILIGEYEDIGKEND